MPNTDVNLAGLFQAVTQSLAEKQAYLDQADEINRDHGSNMLQTFQIITNALEKKSAGPDSAALRFAAKQLTKQTSSGSGQLYAEHLNAAADQFKGKKVDAAGALQLLQTLIGSSQSSQTAPRPAAKPSRPSARPSSPAKPLRPSPLDNMAGQQMLNRPQSSKPAGSKPHSQPPQTGSDDLMGALLGGLAGGGGLDQQPPQTGGDLLGALLGGLAGGQGASQPPSQAGGDLLGALLGGLAGGGAPAQSYGSGDLLGALLGGLAGGSSSGGSGNMLPLLIQAFLKNSSMGRSAHREQSTEVVVDSFLRALGSMSRQ